MYRSAQLSSESSLGPASNQRNRIWPQPLTGHSSGNLRCNEYQTHTAIICADDALEDDVSGGVSLLGSTDKAERESDIYRVDIAASTTCHEDLYHGGVQLPPAHLIPHSSGRNEDHDEMLMEGHIETLDSMYSGPVLQGSGSVASEPFSALRVSVPLPDFQESGFYVPMTSLQNHIALPAETGSSHSLSQNDRLVTQVDSISATESSVQQHPSETSAPTYHHGTARQNGHEDIHSHPMVGHESTATTTDEADVMTFIDRWHTEMDMPEEAGLIRLDAERIRDWRPPNGLAEDNPYGASRDIQGIDWSRLDTDRESATMARRMFYPFRYRYHQQRRNRTRLRQQSFYSFSRMHNNHKAEFSHYQLRHLLAATSRNDVFYAAHNKVMRTSLACPSVADPIINLSGATLGLHRSQITTLALTKPGDFSNYASDSVLITGGFDGEYSLLNLNASHTTLPTEGFVSHAMDGITTHIHSFRNRRSGSQAVAFCSNDRVLRLLDIATNTFTSAFKYADQPNCAATSPDSRLRVVVGDSQATLITDAERGNVLFTLQGHTDHAFACAWADEGWNVATGAQDGKIVIYDARKWDTALTTLDCELGCARSLQFIRSGGGGGGGGGERRKSTRGWGRAATWSSSSMMLVAAESDDVVNIFDAQTWASKQTIDFFGAVAGVAVLDQGRELVVANSDRTVGGLMVFECDGDTSGGGYGYGYRSHASPVSSSRTDGYGGASGWAGRYGSGSDGAHGYWGRDGTMEPTYGQVLL